MDCISGMDQLAPESVDLAFADPPFNIGYKYDVYDDAREAEHYLDACGAALDAGQQAGFQVLFDAICSKAASAR